MYLADLLPHNWIAQNHWPTSRNNSDLLKKVYPCSGSDMETTWRKHLKDQSRYLILSPEKLLEGLDPEKYHELLSYLKTRYQ